MALWPAKHSLTIARYRGSKICSGNSAPGNNTVRGRGKTGSSSSAASSVLMSSGYEGHIVEAFEKALRDGHSAENLD